MPLGEDVELARGTRLQRGGLANIVNEAALIAARHNKQLINMSDFEEAKDKLILQEKKSRDSRRGWRRTAVHEIGHVLTSVFR